MVDTLVALTLTFSYDVFLWHRFEVGNRRVKQGKISLFLTLQTLDLKIVQKETH